MSEKKLAPIEKLMRAMDQCALTRGHANWTNGYRAAKEPLLGKDEANRLHDKEQKEWGVNATAERRFRRLALRLLREARNV